MGYLKVNGRELFYHQTGHGSKTVFIVHGGPGLTLDYLKIVHNQLPAEDFTVVSYNQSGSFDSSPEYYRSVPDYATELKAVIEHFGPENSIVIGHSWGVAVVLELLLAYPSLVDKAVLMNGFCSGKQLKQAIQLRVDALPEDFHQQRKAHLANNDPAGYGALLFKDWLPKHVINLPDFPDDLMLSITQQGVEVSTHFIGSDTLNITGELLNWDRHDDLNSITTPILLMSGKYDYLSKEETENMQQKLGNAQFWYSEVASHMPMYEDPENFKNALITFLSA